MNAGVGAFGRQDLSKDMGVFARGMYADGKTKVDAYTSTDRSLSIDSLLKRHAWSRPSDLAGLAYNLGWISDAHAQRLQMGSIDGFVGDDHITMGPELALDLLYGANFQRSLWLSGDYQHLTNPAFNRVRGPVNIFSV